ncbi:MAG: glucose-6-phosphate isomerase [Deltaproteobacteria bacterium]|nr:MAG: glucose-6-phosphate isomerase [Deltaproteobacteria bacterium]
MSRNFLDIDVSFALKKGNPAGRGLSDSELRKSLGKIKKGMEKLTRLVDDGEVGFTSLPYYENELKKVTRIASSLRRRYRRLVVLGIGGSALGTKAVIEGLRGVRKMEEVTVFDNVDPEEFVPALEEFPPGETLFTVISKSGGTAETLAQYFLVLDLLKRRFKEGWKERVVVITDPKKGFLREVAEKEGLLSFSVPPSVGGRFSVFTPVGLFPLSFAGVRVRKLLEGARVVDGAFRTLPPEDNPVLLLAAVYRHFFSEAAKNAFVFFIYSSFLKRVGEWFCQLWGESLGKRDGSGRPVGQIPVVVTGVTDQHSQLQLYADGPDDKIYTFLRVVDRKRDRVIRGAGSDGRTSFLEGKRLGELFDSEFDATRYSLAGRGRPVVTITGGRRDEDFIGGLLYLMQCVTAIVGLSCDLNPFDQPGVEEGKILTKAMLGDASHSSRMKDLEKFRKGEGRKKVRLEL